MKKKEVRYYVGEGGPLRYRKGDTLKASPQMNKFFRRMETLDNGLEFVSSPSVADADVVFFMGGSDVSPILYGEKPLSCTTISDRRDLNDLLLWRFSGKSQLRVGICRGAQFLNVMSGGKLWQHINSGNSLGHSSSHRIMRYVFDDDFKNTISHEEYEVTSTHHQMMIPGEDGVVLGTAIADGYFSSSLVSEKYSEKQRLVIPSGSWDPEHEDPEVVWYPKTKSLCIQGHPEFHNAVDDFVRDVAYMIKERV